MNASPLRLQQEQYTRRRRGLRRLLTLALLVTAAIVVLAFWAALHRRGTLNNGHAGLPQNLARRLSGEVYTRSEKNGAIFSIHAARTLAYNQGSSTLLEDVHVVIFGRTGNRRDEIHTNRCLYATVTGALTCYGKATIILQGRPAPQPSARPPVILHTSNVSYDSRDSLVKTKQVAHFQYGASSGVGVGLVYNTQKGWLDLKKNVALELVPRSSARLPVRVTAGGLHYAKLAGQITLRTPVQLSQAGRLLKSKAGILYLDTQGRARQAVLFGGVEGFAKLPAGNFQGSAQRVNVLIDPATSKLTRLDAAGSVQLAVQNGPQGSVRRLTADHVLVHLSTAKQQPESGTASGNVHVVYEPMELTTGSSAKGGDGKLARTRSAANLTAPQSRHSTTPAPHRPGAPQAGGFQGKRILTAAQLNFRFDAKGVLESASTVGPGVIRLIPQSASSAHQTITAGQVLMAFDQQGRLRKIRGLSGSRILSQPGRASPRGAMSEITVGNTLDAVLEPSAGTIKTLRQTGDFKFWQGDRRAASDAAYYSAQNQLLTLAGHPVVWDADSRMRAHHIEMNLGNDTAKGWGAVQSIHFDPAAPPGQQGVSRNSPASGSPAQRARGEQPSPPLIVVADQVIAKKNSQFARYQGNVKAWRGPDVVESSSLDVYRKQQRVSSGFGVLTSLIQAPSAASNSAPKSPQARNRAAQPLTIHADRLVYFNLGQEAVYRGHVRAESRDATLHAERLEAYFTKPERGGEPEVTRLVADGNVTAVQLPDRRAKGQHAEYFIDSGKIILTGGPPVIYDAKQGFLTAPRLTFFTHDASLFADGGRKTPALSRYRMPPQ